MWAINNRQMLSKYEEIIEKAKKEGRFTDDYGSLEHIGIMGKINKSTERYRMENKTKQVLSEIEISNITFQNNTI